MKRLVFASHGENALGLIELKFLVTASPQISD